MRKRYLLLFLLLFWVICGVLNFGMSYAHDVRDANLERKAVFYSNCWFDRFNRSSDMIAAAMGPIWTPLIYLETDFAHSGLQYKWERPECR